MRILAIFPNRAGRGNHCSWTPTRMRRKALDACVALVAVLAGLALFAPSRAYAAQPITVVEYYNRALDAYFITGRATEQALLDAATRDFSRTGMSFAAEAATSASAGSVSVCRFFVSMSSPFVSSHFYGREDTDCALIRSALPAGFTDEGVDFAVAPANAAGACPASAPIAVYRSFRAAANGRTPNHRYLVSTASSSATIAAGWAGEGVAFCVASATDVTLPVATSFKRIVSAASSPFTSGCNASSSGTLYAGGEVEPSLARNPINPNHMIASWQQDRWSNGGAQGTYGAVTFDGGLTWQSSAPAFSRCGGGNANNGGLYERASDPWGAISPDGVAYQMALGFSGTSFTADGLSAMLVSRSVDGGRTWAAPKTLVRDFSADVFHDKNTLTADPTSAAHVYAVWGRILGDGSGPAWFARTTDAGATWEAARPIYDPGATNQTLGNQIVVLPNGMLLNVFFEIIRAETPTNPLGQRMRVQRSADRGATWGAPITIAEYFGVGTVDPETFAALRDATGLASISVGKDGRVHVVWQDARFGLGGYDGIAYSVSSDAGLTWSAPVRVNARADVPALIPTVHVRADGVIGVSYYDFRENTSDSKTLPTVYRLAVSADGVNWRESEINAAFEMRNAPVARGYFLGDYQGLSSNGSAFSALYARTVAGGNAATNATEIVFANVADGSLKRQQETYRAGVTPDSFVVTPDLKASVSQAVERAVAWRIAARSEENFPRSP